MEKVEVIKVPQNKLLRKEMLEAARKVVGHQNIDPPGNFDILSELADSVVRESGFDTIYREFAMILCGNEIWRTVVEAVPFDRRLLLLPQCLRNKDKCDAEFDDMGLICNGCKNCNIDLILAKAESLGYTCLVAEGTTMAMDLLQEGSVDAIIGVSCTSVLEKSFGVVARSGIPMIGIPLLNDGCINTDVDQQWVIDELTAFRQSTSHQPISVFDLRKDLKEFFIPKVLEKYFPAEEGVTAELAIRSILAGGQRIRPLLTALAYVAYSSDYSRDLKLQLALIIECFHKASLIHDDLEDRDDYRYEKETLHFLHGSEVAINSGDYLIGKGYQLLGSLPLSSARLTACLKVVANGHVTLSVGQGDDLMIAIGSEIVSLDELLRIFAQKTGAAIGVSLLLGAHAAGAPSNDISILNEFSLLMGMAYQIRDDLEEFRENEESSRLSDYPLLLSMLAEEKMVDTKYLKILLQRSDKKKIDKLIHKYDIEKKVEILLQEYIEKAYENLDELSNLRMKLGIYVIMRKIFS